MTTRVVGGTILDLAGTPIPNQQITITLKAPVTFRTGDSASLIHTQTVFTNSSGVWSATLECNDTINPAGTLYEVKEDYDFGGFKSYLINVPSSLVGTTQVADIIVPEMIPYGQLGNWKGDPGPVGPPGPPGTPGASTGSANYDWSTSIIEGDPGSGRIRMNNADETLATELYASIYDTNGSVVRLGQLIVDASIYVYVSGEINTYVEFIVTDTVTNNADQWFLIPISWVKNGSEGFNPVTNQDVTLQVTAYGPQGPIGPPGPPGPIGPGVPAGGNPGDVVIKAGVTDYDTGWGIPSTGGATSLDGLTDVAAPTPADKQVLTYVNASGQWENEDLPTIVTVDPGSPTGGKDGDLWVQTSDVPYSPPAELPKGIIAWKTGSGSIALTSGGVAVFSLSNVALKAGRLYRYSFQCRASNAPTANTPISYRTPNNVAVPGTTLNPDFYVFAGVAPNYNAVHYDCPFTVTADGNYTITINAAASSGAVYPTYASVEDIGPVRGQQ